MMISRDELIDEVAIRIARQRLNVPASQHDKEFARVANTLGWSIEYHPERVSLTGEELDVAWARSDRVLRAWA